MKTDVNTKYHPISTPGTHRRNIEDLEKPKDCLWQTEANTKTGRQHRQKGQTHRHIGAEIHSDRHTHRQIHTVQRDEHRHTTDRDVHSQIGN